MDHETIAEILGRSESSRAFYHFYQAIRRNQPNHATNALPPLGKLDVFLDPNNGPSRTAYVNRKGMLITASTDPAINPIRPRRRATWTNYTAVVVPQTDDGDLWIRSMESPAHDAIQPEQLSEPEEQQMAKTLFASVRRQLREIIDSEMEIRHTEISENLSELARYLPAAGGKQQQELSELQLAVTRIETRPLETQIPDQHGGEEIGLGARPERGKASAGHGHNGRVDGSFGEAMGRHRKKTQRIPIQSPRAIPVNEDQLRISFTPRLEGPATIEVSIHPRGYEATVEAAISLSQAQCVSSDAVSCALLEGKQVKLFTEPGQRIGILLTTTQPIDKLSAFDLLVREAE